MSKSITVELPDDVFDAVKESADATGVTPDEWVAEQIRYLLPVREPIPSKEDFHPLIYELIEKVAPQMGMTTEELCVEWKKRSAPKPRPQLTPEELESARQRMLRHAGAVNSGDPHSADNDRIDEDLAREYGSTHEDEA